MKHAYNMVLWLVILEPPEKFFFGGNIFTFIGDLRRT